MDAVALTGLKSHNFISRRSATQPLGDDLNPVLLHRFDLGVEG